MYTYNFKSKSYTLTHTVISFMLIISIAMFYTACGDEEGVVSVNLKVNPLLNANLSPLTLPDNGNMKVTAFDVNQGGIRKQESKTFDLASKSGTLGKLDFGTWRFYIEAEGNNETFYGVTAPFAGWRTSDAATVYR